MKTLSAQEFAEKVRADGAKIFSVKFVKRTTGEMREMTCRTGVKKHLKGGDAAYNFRDNGLVSVFDMASMGYRAIPLEGLREATFEGETYKIAPRIIA